MPSEQSQPQPHPANLEDSFRRLSISIISHDDSQNKESLKAKKKQYNDLVTAARHAEKTANNIALALREYRRAFALFSHDAKLKQKIDKLQSLVGSSGAASAVTASFPSSSTPASAAVAPISTATKQATTYASIAQKAASPSDKDRAASLPDEHGFVFDAARKQWILQLPNSPANKTFIIDSKVYSKLYGYQRACVRWLWEKCVDTSVRGSNGGALLADDMGLGKTVQIASFLQGVMYQTTMMKRVLILAPVSVLDSWLRELQHWCIDVPAKRATSIARRFFFFHNISTSKRRKELIDEFRRDGGVLLTSYGIATSQVSLLTFGTEEQSVLPSKASKIHYDLVILDEGHKVKNPGIKLSQNLRELQSDHRFVLTGTPVQNDLMELHALFDYIFEGKLLGDAKSFKANFARKIVRGKERDASSYERAAGERQSQQLRRLIEPYFLKRTKAQVLGGQQQNVVNETLAFDTSRVQLGDQSRMEGVSGLDSTIMLNTSQQPRFVSQKNDFICWVKSVPLQIDLYQQYLRSDDVRDILKTSESALAAITILKQICSHPNLVPANKDATANDTIQQILAKSGKLQFLDKLLQMILRETLPNSAQPAHHKVLIFSQSTQILDMVCALLDHRQITWLRIDGTTKAKDRQQRVDAFNNQGLQSDQYQCFLLTTQAGGVGLTLTAADRVVIFDPAWNPSVDNQAVDRAFRIGQTRNVVVYRLITCGTVEEKIYKKQVFKGLLSKSAVQESGAGRAGENGTGDFRYFSHSELHELFKLGDTDSSETQLQLMDILNRQGIRRKSYPELQNHLQALLGNGDVRRFLFDISDHDLLYNAKERSPLDNSSMMSDEASGELFAVPLPVTPQRTQDPRTAVLNSGFSLLTPLGSGKRRQQQVQQSPQHQPPRIDKPAENDASAALFKLSHMQKQLLKGIRMFGEGQASWTQITGHYLQRYNIGVQYALQEWTKIKTTHSLDLLKRMLVAIEQDLRREVTSLPPMPQISPSMEQGSQRPAKKPVVIDLISPDASPLKGSRANGQNQPEQFESIFDEEMRQLQRELAAKEYTPSRMPVVTVAPIALSPKPVSPFAGVERQATTAAITDAIDNMFSPIVSKAQVPAQTLQTPLVDAKEIAGMLESPQAGSACSAGAAAGHLRIDRESLGAVSRRLSMCFGLLDSSYSVQDSEEGLDEDETDDAQAPAAPKRGQKNKREPSYSSMLQNTSQTPLKPPRKRRNVVYDSDDEEDAGPISAQPVGPAADRDDMSDIVQSFNSSLNISGGAAAAAQAGVVTDALVLTDQPFSSRLSSRPSALTGVPYNAHPQQGERIAEETRLPPPQEYVNLLREGRRYQLQGDLPHALDLYIQALNIDDNDIKLHCMICMIAKQLGFMP